MSKFIAMLSALAMLTSTSCVVLADETTGDPYYDDSYYEDTYVEPEGEEVNDDYNNPGLGTEPGEQPLPSAPSGTYTDNSATSVPVINITSKKDGAFTDVPADSYYADSVKFCYERGLFNGMTDTEFAPDVTMTRGMFATVFGRIQNADLTNVTLTFEDVKADAYYASYIAWATKEGIMDGYSEKAFGPDDSITREQAAKMLHAYLGNVKNINITDVAADYADMANVSDWAAKAINANTSVGYLRADENNNINPAAELTRADACFAVATTIRLVEALEAEGLKDAGENTADDEAVEIKDTDK